MIEQKLHGIGPLRPDPNRPSSLVGSLTEALWYVADGRSYEELAAATGSAFLFSVGTDDQACPGQWLERCPDISLETASRSAGISLTYRETTPDCEQSNPLWLALREELFGSLEARLPVLARGGWAGRDTLDWGILTGVHASGLPAGHCWSGGTNSIEGLATAPTQLIFFGREMARPSAQELTVEILHNAARALRGELSGHVTLGQAWLSGPAGMNRWAERLESGERYCTICADDRRCLQRVTEFYRASRRWAGRFLSETAALRLNSVRPARELGRQMQALADGLGTDPGTIRAAGQAELELAGRISELLGE